MFFKCPIDLDVPSPVRRKLIKSQIDDILTSQDHPFSKLNRLFQKGALAALSHEKFSSSEQNSALVTVRSLDGDTVFQALKPASNLQEAKRLAAEEVLQQVVPCKPVQQPQAVCSQLSQADLQQSTPARLLPPLRTLLTPGELRQKDQDSTIFPLLDEIFEGYLKSYDDGVNDRVHRQQGLHHSPSYHDIGLVSIDLEQWERSPDNINLEIGIAATSAADFLNRKSYQVSHIINKSHLHLVNQMPGYDKRYDFNYGNSIFADNDEIVDVVEKQIRQYMGAFRRIFVVGHSITGDIQWLQRMNITIINDMIPLDIAKVFRRVVSPVPYNLFGQSKMARALGIETEDAHNAGNDAYVALAIASVLISSHAFGWPSGCIDLDGNSTHM